MDSSDTMKKVQRGELSPVIWDYIYMSRNTPASWRNIFVCMDVTCIITFDSSVGRRRL